MKSALEFKMTHSLLRSKDHLQMAAHRTAAINQKGLGHTNVLGATLDWLEPCSCRVNGEGNEPHRCTNCKTLTSVTLSSERLGSHSL